MIEKKLYTFCALLSLSCSSYAMEGEIEEGKFASSTSFSRAEPSFSGPTPDQESDEVDISISSPGISSQSSPSPQEEVISVSSPATSAQTSAQESMFSHDKEKVIFTRPGLEAAARDEKEDQRARNLLDYLGFLIQENGVLPDSERWGDTNRVYEFPLLQEELSDNPPRRFRSGSLINPLRGKYGKDSAVSMKISTLIGALPSTKDALTRLSKLTGKPRSLGGDHKTREMSLRKSVYEASYIIEEERMRAVQEKEALLSELERLKAENEELKAQAARSRD